MTKEEIIAYAVRKGYEAAMQDVRESETRRIPGYTLLHAWSLDRLEQIVLEILKDLEND